MDHPVEGRRERLRHHLMATAFSAAETTIKIELNLKLTGSHPEQGNLRAGICFNRRQLWRKYSAIHIRVTVLLASGSVFRGGCELSRNIRAVGAPGGGQVGQSLRVQNWPFWRDVDGRGGALLLSRSGTSWTATEVASSRQRGMAGPVWPSQDVTGSVRFGT